MFSHNNKHNNNFDNDEKIINDRPKYKLIVEIRSCKNLEDKKLVGEHAVYVAVDVLNETKRTKTLKNIENPKWNEPLIFEINEIPNDINIRVRDDRMLLPNLNLGNIKVNVLNRLISDHNYLIPTILENGEMKLLNSPLATIDFCVTVQDISIPYISPYDLIQQEQHGTNIIRGPYEEIDKKKFNLIPEQVFEKVDVQTTSVTTSSNIKNVNEYHVLPTIHVQEQPRIIEKEVEYIKPIEVKETIIEKEIPKIIEKPIIVEKKEHYLENTQVIREEKEQNTKIINSENIDYNNSNMISDLRKEREMEFNQRNQIPIVEHVKEQIILEEDIQSKPTQVHEKEIIYEQPIEIERKQIEKIQPTIIENVTIDKEHIIEKEQPQIITQNATVIHNKDHYYSQQDRQ